MEFNFWWLGILIVVILIIIGVVNNYKPVDNSEREKERLKRAEIAKRFLDEEMNKIEDPKEVESQDIDFLEFFVAGAHIGKRFSLSTDIHFHGGVVELVKDPKNKYDSRAIKVINGDGQLLGYVPSDDLEVVHDIFSKITECTICDVEDTGSYKSVEISIEYKI